MMFSFFESESKASSRCCQGNARNRLSHIPARVFSLVGLALSTRDLLLISWQRRGVAESERTRNTKALAIPSSVFVVVLVVFFSVVFLRPETTSLSLASHFARSFRSYHQNQYPTNAAALQVIVEKADKSDIPDIDKKK